MPMQIANLTAAVQAALQAWNGRRLTMLIQLSREVTAETNLDEFARDKVGELLAEHFSDGITRLVIKLVEWGEDIDDRLDNVWDRIIRDPDVRAVVEKYDNPTLLFLTALDELVEAISTAAEEVQHQTPEQVVKGMLAIRGGGLTIAPFGSRPERGPRKVPADKIAAARERLAAKQAAAETQPAGASVEATVASLQAQLDALLSTNAAQQAEIASLQAQLEAARSTSGDGDDTPADQPTASTEQATEEQPAAGSQQAGAGASGSQEEEVSLPPTIGIQPPPGMGQGLQAAVEAPRRSSRFAAAPDAHQPGVNRTHT